MPLVKGVSRPVRVRSFLLPLVYYWLQPLDGRLSRASAAPFRPHQAGGDQATLQAVELDQEVFGAAKGRVLPIGWRIGDQPGGDEPAGKRAQRNVTLGCRAAVPSNT
jgi:hypothetical protein